jgi:hypothetical protein
VAVLPSVSRRAACTRCVAECACCGAAVRGIHDRRRGLVDGDLAGRHLDRVAHETRDGSLHVEHLELVARPDDDALVGDLTAALGVQRGLGEDDLDDLARAGARDGVTVGEDAEDRRLRLEVGVAREDGLALGAQSR